jgi:ABC-type cobalamin/Fe3+-siderophores transport system ATPase subunit
LSDGSTLAAEQARIDLAGRPLLSGLSLSSSAERLALLGDWSALFRLLSAEATLAAGSVRVAGLPVPAAVRSGQVGLMQLDPQLPAGFSGEQLLGMSAELAGQSPKAALESARALLERLQLRALATRRIGHLPSAERRALLVAHALLTDPLVLCLEQPLANLDSSAEQLLLAVIERAASGRRLIIALSGPEQSPGERALLERCDGQLRLAAGVVLHGPEAPPARARGPATVFRNHQAYAAALKSRGLLAHPTHEAGLVGALTSVQAGPAWRYLVELEGESSAGVLDAALETDAGLVELEPIA